MKIRFIISALLLAGVSLTAQTNVWEPSPGHVQIPIWPGAAPDLQPPPGPEYAKHTTLSNGEPLTWVCNVSKPTMTVYSPSGTNTGVAMLVFPGGGYNALAMDLEGTEICAWLNAKGITGILLKYRVPTNPKVGPYSESPQALEDAQRTLSLVRLHAADWHIDPHRIGVIGFSAGGGMVTMTSTHFNRRAYRSVDAVDQVSCRPDFAVACYPGHCWSEDEGFKLNPNVTVQANTPPTFIVQAEDDNVDGVNQALVYYIGLKKAGVPVEMHLYAHGGHGFGLRPSKYPITTAWPPLVEKWLGTIGMMRSE